jgi:hypothetical protein
MFSSGWESLKYFPRLFPMDLEGENRKNSPGNEIILVV